MVPAAAMSLPDLLAVSYSVLVADALVCFAAVVLTAAVDEGIWSLKGPQLAWAKQATSRVDVDGPLRLLRSKRQLRTIGSSLQ